MAQRKQREGSKLKIHSNKEWVNYVRKLIPNGEVLNYQVKYRFSENNYNLKYVIVKVKFKSFKVRMKIENNF